MDWQKWPVARSRQGELLHVPLQPGSVTADSGAAGFGGAVAQLWPLPAAVGLAGEATVACGHVCAPAEAWPSARNLERGLAPSCWWVGGRGLPGKVVSAPRAALQAGVWRGRVRLLMTPLFGPTFLFAAQY